MKFKNINLSNINRNIDTYFYQQGGNLVYSPFVTQSLNDNKLEYLEETGLFDVDPKTDNLVVEPVKPWSFGEGYIGTYQQPITEQLITRGVTEFKNENIDVGNMRELLDKFEEAGISVRVTSGVENRKTKSGKKSKHSIADAIDITPIKGQTYTDLKNQIMKNPELLKYMRENNIGIIDETDPLIKMKTGATGDHWHISRNENFALHSFNKMFGRE